MGLFSQKIEPTSITANIDRATDYRQQEENWDLIVQIIDVVGRTETGAKEARKLLQHKMKTKDTHVQLLALGIIKALADNCGTKFQLQLVAKSFLEDLQTIYLDPTTHHDVQSRILEYLSVWASAEDFIKNDALKPLRTLYVNLRDNKRVAAVRQENVARVIGIVPITETEKQQQVVDDIELAKNNAHMLSQAVTFADPDKEDVAKNELIQEFNGKCREMHKTIMSYLSRDTTDPQLISTLIEVNQELLNSFKSYDDLMEQSNVANATKVSEQVNYRGTGGNVALVDFASNESSSNMRPTPAAPYTIPTSADPFDPFGDENQVSDDTFAPLQPTVVGNGKGKQRETEGIV